MAVDNFDVNAVRWRVVCCRVPIVLFIRITCAVKCVLLFARIVPIIVYPYALIIAFNLVDVVIDIVSIALLIGGTQLNKELFVKIALMVEALSIVLSSVTQVCLYVWLMVDTEDFITKQEITIIQPTAAYMHQMRIIYSAFFAFAMLYSAVKLFRFVVGDIALCYKYLHAIAQHGRRVEVEETRIVTEALEHIAQSIADTQSMRSCYGVMPDGTLAISRSSSFDSRAASRNPSVYDMDID